MNKLNKQISNIIGGYHKTIKKLLEFPGTVRKRSDKGNSRGFFHRSQSRIKREELVKCTGETTVSRTSRCCDLKLIAMQVTPVKNLHYPRDKQNRLKWVENILKVDFFSKVFFTDEAIVLPLMNQIV